LHLSVFRAAHVTTPLLREHLLAEHPLQRAELDVDLHRVRRHGQHQQQQNRTHRPVG